MSSPEAERLTADQLARNEAELIAQLKDTRNSIVAELKTAEQSGVPNVLQPGPATAVQGAARRKVRRSDAAYTQPRPLSDMSMMPLVDSSGRLLFDNSTPGAVRLPVFQLPRVLVERVIVPPKARETVQKKLQDLRQMQAAVGLTDQDLHSFASQSVALPESSMQQLSSSLEMARLHGRASQQAPIGREKGGKGRPRPGRRPLMNRAHGRAARHTTSAGRPYAVNPLRQPKLAWGPAGPPAAVMAQQPRQLSKMKVCEVMMFHACHNSS